MRAELIMIGTELLLGEVVDTNATFLAQNLADLGIDLFYKSTVGDNLGRGQELIRLAMTRSDLVIISGGLGPTDDDLTRDMVSLATGRKLEENTKVLADLKLWFRDRYGEHNSMPPHNQRQAHFPQGSEILANTVGTAPGFWLDVAGRVIVALPGVPHELKEMFCGEVAPRLLAKGANQSLVVRNLRFIGIGESSLEELLEDLIAVQTNPTIALYASAGSVRVRLAAKAPLKEEGLELIKPLEQVILARTEAYLYSSSGQSLEEVVAEQLLAAGLTLALAESCTGGLISHRLTNVPGSSGFFQRGYVAYSNQAKVEDLGVKKATLEMYGAVSAQVASEMAEGVRQKARTDLGLGVTGIAGPGGGSEEKPVGLVYMSLATSGDTTVQRHLWRGTREQIKNRAALAALHLLWQASRE